MAKKTGLTNDEAKAASRRALLKSGAELFAAKARLEPFGSMRMRDICERAGYSTGAYYVHWSGADEYFAALAHYLLTEEEGAWDGDFAELREIAEQPDPGDAVEWITRLATADLDSVSNNETWEAMELLTLAIGSSPEFNRQAADGYRSLDCQTGDLYEVVIKRLGREPRPPYDYGQIGVALQAVVEGVALRRRIDPNAVAPVEDLLGPNLYATVVMSVLSTMTRVVGDRASFVAHMRSELGGGVATAQTDAPRGHVGIGVATDASEKTTSLRGDDVDRWAGVIGGRTNNVVLEPSALSERIAELGTRISRDYDGRDPVLVCVLKGAMHFFSDLVRHITVPCETDFMTVTSYSGTKAARPPKIEQDISLDIRDRDVIVVEDIVDSGATIETVLARLGTYRPRSLEICTLLVKPATPRTAEYVGFKIDDAYVIGYGLDLDERYRQLPYIAELPDT